MSNITAQMVKELRDRTGAGMMECKKALLEASGDMEKAVEEMRKAGQAKADKKSSRIAAEGVLTLSVSEDNKIANMIEINCETDFVARDDSFQEFVKEAVNQVAANPDSDLESLLRNSLEEKREKLVQKLGENIVVRRISRSVEHASS